MRKHFLILMLLSLLPLAGWAQFSVNNYVQKGNFIYKITEPAVGENPGRVVLYGIRDGYNPVDESKALNLEGKITIAIVDGPSFDFIVDYAEVNALKKTYAFTTFDANPTEVGAFAGMVNAESVVIPKEFQTIKANQFYGYTNMKSIGFQEGSEVTTIESGAFNTTQISTFDFRYCSKLTTINNGLFVEADPAINTYVTTITLPEASEALVTIGTAFQRLPNLTAINNLDKSLITTVEALAFNGDTSLETLALPGTVETIAATAFQGSGIKNLTIDVTSLNDPTAGNVYGTSTAVLESLTLKGVLSQTFKSQAFKGCNKLETLTMTDMTINGGTIDASAFENCSKLTSVNFNDITNGTFGANAFKGCSKLNAITFGTSENLAIGESAFENSASNGSAATLTFGNAVNLTIAANAFKGATKLETINFGNIADDDTPSDEIAAGAFENATGLKSLTFGNLTDVEIKGNAFKAATSALTGTNYATAIFGNLEGSTIEDAAFVNATRLNSVTFGDVTDSKIGAGANVFPAVKTVSIGAVESTDDVTLIGANAFKYANQKGATLSLADGKSLETVAGATEAMIATGAFDFSAVVVAAGWVATDYPVATIGEIKTAKTLATGALKGEEEGNIAKIIFNGDIASGALDAMIVDADCQVPTVIFNGNIAAGGIMANTFAALPKLATITFNNGEIATGGIAKDAFKNLALTPTITFNGKLAAGAVAQGAFEALKINSQVIYTYNEEDIDLTVNPFHKQAFKATSASANDRIIKFAITNTDLKAKFKGATGLETDGDFDVYLAYFFVPADLSFLVYPDIVTTSKHTASPRTAWARWELGARVDENITGSLAAGDNLVIKRVQQIDGTNKAKITIYGSYTDEDDALNAATIYMIPLKVTNGYYYIPGTNKTTLIVKVENSGADFTENSYKVKVNQTGWVYDADKNSIWTGLENKELYVASNIMTNQQLVDKQAADAANAGGGVAYGYYHNARTKADVDIYRGGTAIAEDLYIMSDPSKNKGFRIDKSSITSTNNAYINAGWYYMLLKKYGDDDAPARVLWMDDITEGEITGILNVKNDAQNNSAKSTAIYTLQGVRVSAPVKGQIYIQNGKKFIVK